MKNKHLALLMSDFYKQAHAEQYPEGTYVLTAYYTPRKSRLKNDDSLIVFWVQKVVKEFLIEQFNETFFSAKLDDVRKEYERVLHGTLSDKYVSFDKWEKLWHLGYLPLKISALPEGTLCPMGVPCVEITNTHNDFAWLTEFIESKLSNDTWYAMCIAKRAYNYRQIVNKYYDETVGEPELKKSAISEFGYRGGEGEDGSIMATAAFLTSFNKTATIPGLLALEDYYNCDVSDKTVGAGMISTEHSVMCSNYAVDGNESAFLKKLLTELYPTGSLSVVIDSYDHHNTLENIICKELKQDILSRDGTVFIRGDSGDPVNIICGDFGCLEPNDYFESEQALVDMFSGLSKATAGEHYPGNSMLGMANGQLKKAVYSDRVDAYGNYEIDVYDYELTAADKGMCHMLWDHFGGTYNELGYKVLNPHVRCIYGDGITPERAELMYRRLKANGFAACNVVLGAGSFSMQCVGETMKVGGDTRADGLREPTKTIEYLLPYTRDTYGIAVKATYAELENGEPLMLFKDPKTDTDKVKKSHRGMCHVHMGKGEKLQVTDGYTRGTMPPGSLLETIFENGEMVKEYSIHDIRKNIWGDSF